MQTYSLHTISEKIGDYKIIIGTVAVVLGTIGSFIFSLINLYIGTRTAPIISQVQAVQSKQLVLEQALMDIKETDRRIESKLDRITVKLIPNANIIYSK